MIKRKFGNLDVEVPIIGQGSWQFPGSPSRIDETKKALALGVELGMTHIDTAEMYGDAEVIIADAIKDLPREKLFIVSKVLPSNASHGGTIAACERSLRRLGVDYLDCYLLHWRGNYPLSDTMSALEKLVDEGKIRSLGVSNFDVDDVKEAEQCLSKHKIACNQVLYNLFTRGIERQLIPYCQSRGIAIVAYTPFGQKAPPAPDTKSGAVLKAIADKHKATARQIMLAFTTSMENTFTIPKSSRPEHTKENAGVGDVQLSKEDIAQIDTVFPAPTRDVPLAMI